MKQILQSFSPFLLIVFLALPVQSFAAFCQSNGGGDWNNPNTWLCDGVPGVPQAGDFIIISGADLVLLTSTADLTSTHNDTPTTMVIFGTLMFLSPGGSCENNECNIDLIMDTDSEIFVEAEEGLQESGPGIGQKDIIIGGVSVLGTNDWPYGPGVLPDLIQLPLSLVSFEAKTLENVNLLTWETEKEEDAFEFIIERAENAQVAFEAIGKVDAFGNSETLLSYNFEDRNPLPMAYYRLKMIDLDGSYEYSDIIAVERAIETADFEVYPIPLQETINIELNSTRNSQATFTLSNILGQIIQTQHLNVTEGQNKFTIQLEGKIEGVHFITVQNDYTRLVKKVL